MGHSRQDMKIMKRKDAQKLEVKVFNGFHPDNAKSIFPQAPLTVGFGRWFAE